MIVVAAFAVIRSSAAPLHEKAGFVGFVLVELVIASGQFWDATFGDGRTFIEVYLMAVILLLATPAGAVTDAARSAHASLLDKAFAPDRAMSGKRLAWVAAPTIVVLIFLLRRHIGSNLTLPVGLLRGRQCRVHAQVKTTALRHDLSPSDFCDPRSEPSAAI